MLEDISVKYALFDMDGTLTDTMHFWMGAANEFLKDEGVALSEEQNARLQSMGVKEGIAYVRSLHISPKTDNYGIEDVCRILMRHYERESVVKDGVRELLEGLRERGVRMGVATLTPSPIARVCLTTTGLLSYFACVLGGEDYPEGKSTPRIFEDAARRFGCAPSDMVLFEDSLYSIKTANAVGISVVGVADRFQTAEREEIMARSVAFFDRGFSVRVK